MKLNKTQNSLHIPYEDLEKHYTTPDKISPFFNHKIVPRKLKKKHKHIMQNNKYKFLDLNQKLFYILEIVNPNYKRFLIKQIVKQ